jgi:hypothetical protein
MAILTIDLVALFSLTTWTLGKYLQIGYYKFFSGLLQFS